MLQLVEMGHYFSREIGIGISIWYSGTGIGGGMGSRVVIDLPCSSGGVLEMRSARKHPAWLQGSATAALPGWTPGLPWTSPWGWTGTGFGEHAMGSSY